MEHIFLSDPDRRARLHLSVCGEVIGGVLHVQTDADKQPKKKIVSTFFKGLSVSLLCDGIFWDNALVSVQKPL